MSRGEASSSSMPNRHFFKPLQAGFIAGVDIPSRFLSKILEEGNGLRTIIMRSEATETSWYVDLTGRKLSNGWKEFVQAHQLDVGDILVFKYTGNLIFDVTAFGPSCREIQYLYGDDVEEEERMIEGNRFVLLTITNDTLKRSRIFLPKNFVTANGLEAFAGIGICLARENGVRSAVDLGMERVGKINRMRLTDGLGQFLKSNHIEANTTIRFEIHWDNANHANRSPVLQLCPKRKRQETGQSISYMNL